MLCFDHNCPKLSNDLCSIYPESGMVLRDKQGYCPMSDLPKKEVKKVIARTGQQKQKKKKV
jgi:hypothetical protein